MLIKSENETISSCFSFKNSLIIVRHHVCSLPLFYNIIAPQSSIMQSHQSTNSLYRSHRGTQPGNKSLVLDVLSALNIHTLKWQLRTHSSGNSLPFSDESSNAPIFRVFLDQALRCASHILLCIQIYLRQQPRSSGFKSLFISFAEMMLTGFTGSLMLRQGFQI